MNNHRNQTNNLKLFRKVTVMKKLMLFVLFLVGITSLSFSQILIQTNDGLKSMVNPTITTYKSVEILPTFYRPATVTVDNPSTGTQIRAIIGSITASGTGMTSGYSATGVRGIATVTGTITGNAYVYGSQGKLVTSTGTIGGQSWSTGVLAQMDLSGASTYTANTGGTMALWVDAGASAHANAKTAAPTLIDLAYISNSISGFKPHSAIRFAGDATNFIAVGDWAGGTSADYITLGGTDCTASGSTDPYATIGIMVGSQQCYIRVWAAK
jgi:hypothetical protein